MTGAGPAPCLECELAELAERSRVRWAVAVGLLWLNEQARPRSPLAGIGQTMAGILGSSVAGKPPTHHEIHLEAYVTTGSAQEYRRMLRTTPPEAEINASERAPKGRKCQWKRRILVRMAGRKSVSGTGTAR
jgi:hypothetical protein